MELPHPLPEGLVDLLAERFHALGEPTRIRLVDRLREGDAMVQDLTVAAGTTQQNASKHLGILHRAGILARRKEGNHVYYSIADPRIVVLCEVVCGSIQQQLDWLHEAIGAARE
jgi:DNA-binding transcriptional ArsR family regulator